AAFPLRRFPQPSSPTSLTEPPSTALSSLSLHDALPIFISLVALVALGSLRSSGSGRALLAATPLGTLVALGTLRTGGAVLARGRSEEHTSELQSRENLVCRLLLEKKKIKR